MGEYRTISIPKELVDEVEDKIITNSKLGYRSIAEFFSTAGRHELSKHEV